jgi:hypothetical protein
LKRKIGVQTGNKVKVQRKIILVPRASAANEFAILIITFVTLFTKRCHIGKGISLTVLALTWQPTRLAAELG